MAVWRSGMELLDANAESFIGRGLVRVQRNIVLKERMQDPSMGFHIPTLDSGSIVCNLKGCDRDWVR